MKKGFLKSLSDTKKIKYSTISIAFCAIVIAIVVILNSISAVLSEKFGWYIDMTDEQLFTLTDDAKDILDSIKDGVEIEIVFPYDKDVIDTNYANSTTSGSIGYVHSTAEQIAAACDNVTLSYHDTTKDYPFYVGLGVADKMGNKDGDKVLILRKTASGEYSESDFRICPVNYFFVGDSSTGELYGYNGELMFLSAILAMTRDTVPIAYFTVGHGELSFAESGIDEINYDNIDKLYGSISNDAFELICMLCDSGFAVRPLDTSTQDIPEDARIIVINQPTSDFDYDELYKIETYLQKTGTVFCFTPHDADLPNLYTMLKSNYGVTVNASENPVTDNRTSFEQKPYSLQGYVNGIEADFAASQYFSSINSYSSASARLEKAATITIDPDYMSEDGYSTGMGILKYTYPLLQTSNTASFGGTTGTHYLMSVTSIETYRALEEYTYFSYLVVCPISSFASDEYLSSSVCSNKDMLLSLIQSTTNVQTPVNIDYKTFMSYELDITDHQAQLATVLLSTVLPAAIAVCGIVVIVRRKHR